MKLAVCLLTADRSDYTCATLESYVEHFDRPDFIRLHADDGSNGESNFRVAEAAGFETVYASQQRCGPMAAIRAMWNEAAKRHGATHILHLENDWEFKRDFPACVERLQDTWESARLYGRYKSDVGERMEVGPHIMGTKERIAWDDPTFGAWQRTDAAHWGGPPSITRAPLMVAAVNKATCFKGLSRAMLRLRTVRPLSNIVNHIGHERTPGARFNA